MDFQLEEKKVEVSYLKLRTSKNNKKNTCFNYLLIFRILPTLM